MIDELRTGGYYVLIVEYNEQSQCPPRAFIIPEEDRLRYLKGLVNGQESETRIRHGKTYLVKDEYHVYDMEKISFSVLGTLDGFNLNPGTGLEL